MKPQMRIKTNFCQMIATAVYSLLFMHSIFDSYSEHQIAFHSYRCHTLFVNRFNKYLRFSVFVFIHVIAFQSNLIRIVINTFSADRSNLRIVGVKTKRLVFEHF